MTTPSVDCEPSAATKGKDDDPGSNGVIASSPRPISVSQDIPLRVTETTNLPPNALNGPEQVYNPDQQDDYGLASSQPPDPKKKKKRKKPNKPASKRGLGAPTGFEDFFADTPLTPEQYAQDKELYDSNFPFVDRILTAIARFQRTRKLTPERNDILHKYLAYGGVDIGPNAFQGNQDTAGMDKTTIMQVRTNASITEEKRDIDSETSNWAVDFLGCIKGFLSRHAPNLVRFGFETRTDVELVTSTLERFMDYLLQHDVCTEYQTQVLATRNFCREATAELWDVAQATRRLPGDFNIACSTMFGGSYANYDGETWWGPDEVAAKEEVFVGFKPDQAHQILHFGVSGAADEHVFAHYLEAVNGSKSLEVVSVTERAGFEITRIEPPSPECKAIYTTHSTNFRPVGRVYAKPWTNPDAPPEDLTAAEREELINKPTTDGSDNQEEYVFFLESILQSHLRVGMKIEATIRQLNCGIMFFDEFLNILPSFDLYLPNEMILGWKPPRSLKGAFDYESSDEESIVGDGDGVKDDGNADDDDDAAAVASGYSNRPARDDAPDEK